MPVQIWRVFCPKSCCKSRGLRMSWKTAVGVLFTITIILGTYLKFFDHPPAEDTLNTNRNLGTFQRPSFIKSVRQKSHPADNSSSNLTFNKDENPVKTSVREKEGEGENYMVSPALSNDTRKETAVSSRESEEQSKEDTDLKETPPLQQRHGIKDFDWNGWAQENEFVNIGSIWSYCDEEEPILVGKILLFGNEGSLSMTLVVNTTFDADITFGTVEVKIMYYETIFFHKTFDLCEMTEKFEDDFFTCPMLQGEKYYYNDQPLSRLMPTGEFNLEMSLRDEYQKAILCGVCKFIL